MTIWSAAEPIGDFLPSPAALCFAFWRQPPEAADADGECTNHLVFVRPFFPYHELEPGFVHAQPLVNAGTDPFGGAAFLSAFHR